jgi:hypothetical protein
MARHRTILPRAAPLGRSWPDASGIPSEADSPEIREPASTILTVDLVVSGGAAAEFALARTLQCGDVDLLHVEHCLHDPSRLRRIRVGEELR